MIQELLPISLGTIKTQLAAERIGLSIFGQTEYIMNPKQKIYGNQTISRINPTAIVLIIISSSFFSLERVMAFYVYSNIVSPTLQLVSLSVLNVHKFINNKNKSK